jgi:hypothetical protein
LINQSPLSTVYFNFTLFRLLKIPQIGLSLYTIPGGGGVAHALKQDGLPMALQALRIIISWYDEV